MYIYMYIVTLMLKAYSYTDTCILATEVELLSYEESFNWIRKTNAKREANEQKLSVVLENFCNIHPSFARIMLINRMFDTS